MNDRVVTHLQMIQEIINRLSGNSFLLKGWYITIVGTLSAFAVQSKNPLYFSLAAFLAIPFWFLDAYYLRLERLYRKLYDDVRVQPSTDFSMNTKVFVPGVHSWLRVMGSKTQWPFYWVPAFTLCIAANLF